MQTSTRSSTPWTVSTSKIKLPASEPRLKKRLRLLSCVVKEPTPSTPTPRQQTLTQIQFAPPALSPLCYEESIGPFMVENAPSVDMPVKELKVRGELRKPRDPRARKGRKKQRNTITQMDFLGVNKHLYVDEDGDEGLGMITPGQLDGTDCADEKENVDPDTVTKAARGKRKSRQALGEVVKKVGKRRKMESGVAASDDPDWDGSTSRSLNQGNAHRIALSERTTDRNIAHSAIFATSRKTRATTKANVDLLQREPPQRFASNEKENFETDNISAHTTIPETPRRSKAIVPSSQSPESISFSSSRKRSPPISALGLSPLKGRSTDGTIRGAANYGAVSGFSPTRNVVSPKKKICVLKYGSGRFRKPELPEVSLLDGNAGANRVSFPLQHQQGPNGRPKRGYATEFRDHEHASETVSHTLEPEIPGTSQAIQPQVIPSSQTDTEEEDEIPETSQGLRKVTSTSSINRSEESLQFLPMTNSTPMTVKETRSRALLSEVEASLHDADVRVDDFTSRHELATRSPVEAASASRRTVNDVGIPSPRLPAQLLQKEDTVPTIGDSQADADDDGGFLLSPELPEAEDTSSHKVPSRRTPTPTAEQTRRQSAAPGTSSSPNLPPLFPLRLPHVINKSAAKITTTLVPTKFPPSSSASPSSSSPNLPAAPSLPPPPPRPRTTQQSIHPASMTRPSQVSTQDPTQPSWLPMSSMPFPNTSTTSSPYSHRRDRVEEAEEDEDEVEHITIKDSSSMPPVVLRDVASQMHSQKGLPDWGTAMVDLGLGPDGFDAKDDARIGEGKGDAAGFPDRDEDLDPKSSPPPASPPSSPRRSRIHNEGDGDDRTTHSPSTRSPAAPAILLQASPEACPDRRPPHPKDSLPPLPPTSVHRPANLNPNPTPNLNIDIHDSDANKRPHLPAVSRLHLSESMLESLPGPPGWLASPDGDLGGGEGDWDLEAWML